jgi:16S rRNA (guanine966-N2)-methyltransferase
VERVREALFNMLGPSVRDASVLDLFAGSGALGIEALSRGARFAAFVDQAHAAMSVIRGNLQALNFESPAPFVLVQRPVDRAAPALRPHGPFDLVLIDPPFAAVRDRTALTAIERLVSEEIFYRDTLFVLEVPSDRPSPEIQGLFIEDERDYGDTHLCFLRLEKARDND